LLNQTSEAKTLPIYHDPQIYNSSPAISQTVIYRRGSCSSMDRFTLAFVKLQILGIRMVFPWYFPLPCQYHYTSGTYCHYDKLRVTYRNSAVSLIKSSFCGSHKIIYKIPSKQLVFVYRKLRIGIWFEQLYGVTWYRRNWYIIIPFCVQKVTDCMWFEQLYGVTWYRGNWYIIIPFCFNSCRALSGREGTGT
jgi:hypothetical protein